MSINLKELSSEFNNLKLDYDLKKKNWFNIGGKTKIYYKYLGISLIHVEIVPAPIPITIFFP